MTLEQLKSELAKINKGCGKTFDNLICGVSYDSSYKPTRFLYCPSCQSKKQGIILGAKMMIEREIRSLQELQVLISRTEYWKNEEDLLTERIFEKLADLKQLDKEIGE